MENPQPEPEEIMLEQTTLKEALLNATFAGMKVIRRYQTGNAHITPEMKINGTFLTHADRKSGLVIQRHLQRLPHNFAITAEDTAGRNCAEATRKILSDGLDGTALLVAGIPTSAVINAEFNLKTNKTSACCIGCPATGIMWYSDDTQEGVTIYRHWKNKYKADEIAAKVWDGDLSNKTTLFLDVPHGFKRRGHQVLTDEQNSGLFHKMATLSRVVIGVSNGLMHALTANGSYGVCGGITTAMDSKGGWDAAGGHLVKNAEGGLRAYSLQNGRPEEVDPLNVESMDLLIFGNSEKTASKLNEIFLSLF